MLIDNLIVYILATDCFRPQVTIGVKFHICCMIHEFHNIIFKGLFLVMFLRQHSLFSHPLIFVFLLHEGNKKNTTSVNNINGLNLTGKLGEADFSLTLHFSFVIFLNKTPTFFCTCARLISLGCIPIKPSWK